YLTDDNVAFNQMNQSRTLYAGKLTSATQIEFSGQSSVSEHFIFCGAKRGTGQLTLDVLDSTGGVIASASADIEIKDIKEMYERYTVGDSAKGPIFSEAKLASEDLPAGPPFSYSYNAGCDANIPYILFVHGWNMERWEKDRFAETAYKRLYLTKHQGRF